VKEITLRHIAIALAALAVLATAPAAQAADGKPTPILHKDSFLTEIGFITGFGYGTVTEGDYLPVPAIVHLGTNMRRWFPSLQDNRGVLTVFLEPQFNTVLGHETSFEAGVGHRAQVPISADRRFLGLRPCLYGLSLHHGRHRRPGRRV